VIVTRVTDTPRGFWKYLKFDNSKEDFMALKINEIRKIMLSLKIAKRNNPKRFKEMLDMFAIFAEGGESYDQNGLEIKKNHYANLEKKDFIEILQKFDINCNLEKKENESENFKIESCVKISPINYYFDKIYLLNLNERSDRLLKSKKILEEHGILFQRFSAVNGKKIDSNILKKYSIKPGEVGCLYSHYEIIQDAKNNNFKKILIFEDDIIFSKNFTSNFLKNLKDLNEDWKILYLGASQHEWKDIEYYKNKFYYSNSTFGTFAYALDHSVYDEILNTKNIYNSPIDQFLTLIQKKYFKKCFTMFPNIVKADVANSDIRESRDQIKHEIKMKWNLIEQKNPLFSIIIPNHRDKFLEETIESLKKQTFKDFECIIVNDTPSKFLDFQDNRFKIYDRPNYLLSNANSCRNYGINLSSGKYLIFLDSDDLLHNECLENRKNIIEANPDFQSYIFFTEYFKLIPGDIKRLVNKKSKFENYLEDFLNYNLLWSTTSCTWGRETIISLKGFNENLHRLQDVDLHIRLLANKNNKIFMDKSEQADCYYRISEFHANLNEEKKLKIKKSFNNLINSYEKSSIKLRENFIKSMQKYLN